MKNLTSLRTWLWIATLSIATLGASAAFAANYEIDPAHTSVGFSIRHMVSHVTGVFTDFTGTFSFDPKNATASSVEFTVKTASVDTRNAKRDHHLQSSDFFDVEKFPTMTFKSTQVAPAGKNKYKITGNLTLHGVTRPETFLVEYGGEMKGPDGNVHAGFSATDKLDRKAYGIIWNKTLDAGSLMLGNDVDVTLDVEAVQKAADTKKM